jgi:hydroxymethylglutaryl-CoA lyase
MPPDILLTDVTLREHGQNVSAAGLVRFTPGVRARLALALRVAGFRRIEVLSCVHPRIAPAMAREQLESVLAELGRPTGLEVVTLVPNERGYDAFEELDLGPRGFGHTVGVFHSAMDVHNLANVGRPVADTVAEIERIARRAALDGVRLTAYVSAAFGFVDAGGRSHPVSVDAVQDQVRRHFDLGAAQVTLSDLQGLADGEETARRWDAVLAMDGGAFAPQLGYHPHHVDPAAAVDLVEAAYRAGVRCFDASLAAAGGCVTGAPGNAPTEGVAARLAALGAETGIDLAAASGLAPDWLTVGS